MSDSWGARGNREEAFEHVAEVLERVLENDQIIRFEKFDGKVLFDTEPASALRAESPKLFGRLVSVEEQLQTGFGTTCLVMLAGISLCVALYLDAFASVLGPEMSERLRSWWIYLLILIVSFFMGSFAADRVERRAYLRNREGLLALMAAEGLDRDTLVSKSMELAPFATRTLRHLKLDVQGPGGSGS